MRGARSPAWRVAQALLAALIVWFAWHTLAPAWPETVSTWRATRFHVAPLVFSALVVFTMYAVLIETWRRVVMGLGGSLPFGTAARIWFVSNLGRYVPGKIWAITAMGAMSRDAGVSPVAAVGSSLLVNVVNILAGIVVILFTASEAIAFSRWAIYALGAAAVAVALTPKLLPSVARWVGARFGRDVTWPPIPQRTVVIAFAGCTVGWLLYGLAFWFLVNSISGSGTAAGAMRGYLAAFTASYLAGYLVLPAPGGFGVREGALIGSLTKLSLATVASATVIVIVSRLWLTVFELLPGLILLAVKPKATTSDPNDA